MEESEEVIGEMHVLRQRKDTHTHSTLPEPDKQYFVRLGCVVSGTIFPRHKGIQEDKQNTFNKPHDPL